MPPAKMPRRVMEFQFTKAHGLKKLKKIVAGSNNWRVAPYVVLNSAENFRRNQMRGMPRALVRTDEIGRVYKRLSYNAMPQGDINLRATNDKRIRQKLGEYVFVDKLRGLLGGKAKLIVHPTKPRGKILWTGRITINYGSGKIELRKKPPVREHYHKGVYNTNFEARVENGTFEIQESRAQTPEVDKILDSLGAFVRTALEKRQIKPASRSNEIYFVIWKDAPGVIEFYDLIERRLRPT